MTTPTLDVRPSLSLQPFLDTNLEKILAPLGEAAFTQTETLTNMKAGYADAQAQAVSDHQPAFQAAQALCDGLTEAIAERQTAVSALHGSLSTRSSEAAQPKGGAYEGGAKTKLGDTFFTTSQQNAWNERAGVLRKKISASYLRERALERRVAVWETAAAANPSEPAATNGPDPVVGKWLLGGNTPIVLGADYSITGGRHGWWSYSSNTDGGRNYELHWKPPKDLTDYLVLSSDGKTLDGHTRHDKPYSASRQ